MLASIENTVSTAFLDVVEQLTFMFVEPIDKSELSELKLDLTCARLEFAGDISGSVTVVVPSAILVDIAANILGQEPDDISPDVLPDALGEMLNVFCGHAIMDLAGTEANFKLGAPEIYAALDDFADGLLTDDNFLGFLLDENPVFVGLTTES